MRWPWQRKASDPRRQREVDVDAEVDAVKAQLSSALDELKVKLAESEWKEGARARQQQHRTRPA